MTTKKEPRAGGAMLKIASVLIIGAAVAGLLFVLSGGGDLSKSPLQIHHYKMPDSPKQ
jgi:hypothetical protein